MSLAVAPYHHDAFSGLPRVVDAGSGLQAKGGRDMIYDMFATLFVKHGIEEK
jgi:hypothetical protein